MGVRFRSVDDVLAWLDGQDAGDAVRLARLLADTATAGALREYADRLIYDMTREATYAQVRKALGVSPKQVMRAVERQRERLRG